MCCPWSNSTPGPFLLTLFVCDIESAFEATDEDYLKKTAADFCDDGYASSVWASDPCTVVFTTSVFIQPTHSSHLQHP